MAWVWICLSVMSWPALAGSRVVAVNWGADGLTRPAPDARVVLVEPDLELSEVLAGGRLATRADWTEAARALLPAEMRRVLEARGARVTGIYVPAADLPPEARIRQILHLHQAVGISIVTRHFGAVKLENKSGFDWTLGPGVSDLREATAADYALFTYVRDSYTSSGRAAMMVVGALLGVAVGGGVQVGFSSLVDLRSGRVLWFNFLIDATGDLRDAEGARETVADLLEEFPL
jgi:hypothetical protein